MIAVKQLCVRKNGKAICSVAELQVDAGERVAILGSNGSGKSTLLRVLSGLEPDLDGQLKVAARRKERVYVHQSPYLFRGTALFNVTYGLRQRGTGGAESERLALEWLERLGMRSLGRSRVSHLSGGERRRVALARAMVLRPRLLLLDEPLAEMDDCGTRSVVAALDELAESTILIASPTELPPGLVARNYRIAS